MKNGVQSTPTFIIISSDGKTKKITGSQPYSVFAEVIVLPLNIELFNFSIIELDERQATLELEFKVTNPNFKSVMLQHVKYSVYNDDKRIVAGGIGSTPEGFVDTPNYFIVLNERPLIVGEKFIIKNSGNTPVLWEALNNWKNSGVELDWRITGDAFINLSSLTSGQENILSFDFSKYD